MAVMAEGDNVKKLLFVLLMVLSGQVMAATEIVIPYSLAPGESTWYASGHSFHCVPTVLSLGVGEGNAAAWLIGISPGTFSVRVMNVGNTNTSGNAKLRLGSCQ